jgi:ribonuclease VapC
MIVADTSAIIAVMLKEPGHERLADLIARSDACFISAVTMVEITMVISRSVRDAKAAVETYLQQTSISVCSIDAAHASLAQHAFLIYGKGRHPARLNCGDCFSYAAAKALNAPLLYVGEDFAKTDISAA